VVLFFGLPAVVVVVVVVAFAAAAAAVDVDQCQFQYPRIGYQSHHPHNSDWLHCTPSHYRRYH